MNIYLKNDGKRYPLQRMTLEIEQLLRAIHAKSRQSFPTEYAELDALLAEFHQAGGLDNVWQDYKLFSLRRMLRELKPRVILELGSGSSTAIFAEYIRMFPGTRMTSVDEYAQWSDTAREMARIVEGDERFRLVTSATQTGQYGDLPATKYRDVPTDVYDFVFIDGPTINDASLGINANIFDLMEENKPRYIVVDMREGTVRQILLELQSSYQCTISDFIIRNLRDEYQYFSVFIKNEVAGIV